MQAHVTALAMISGLLATALSTVLGAAQAQTPVRGGTLRIYLRETPPSASIHEEATFSTVMPFSSVFNNLVVYDPHAKQNRLDTIVPELAESWSWNEAGTELTFTLHQGVKWHDGKPFTARDVQCTWNMVMEKPDAPKLRKNPRKSWYQNLESVTVSGDYEVTFHLKRPQPAFLALLAAGMSPVYPCHVNANAMRTKPIGTGPFKVAEIKQNDAVRLTRNPDYWKPGQPYLDGLDLKIIKNRATAVLAFIADELDFASDISVPLANDIKARSPHDVCEVQPANTAGNLLINREAGPFDNPDVRRALALVLDRKAFVDILTENNGFIGGVMLPQPKGVWGMPPEMVATLLGYGPDLEARRTEARRLMQTAGFGPDKRMQLKVITRNLDTYRNATVILLDQLKTVYVDAEMDVLETSSWYSRLARKEYALGLNIMGNGLDEPDQNFYENYACGSERNYTQYCNPEMEKLFDAQSMEADQEKRKRLVWEIERRLQDDVARPMLYFSVTGTCFKPRVKNFTVMVNSNYNLWRFDNVWIAR